MYISDKIKQIQETRTSGQHAQLEACLLLTVQSVVEISLGTGSSAEALKASRSRPESNQRAYKTPREWG